MKKKKKKTSKIENPDSHTNSIKQERLWKRCSALMNFSANSCFDFSCHTISWHKMTVKYRVQTSPKQLKTLTARRESKQSTNHQHR
jgi:hypothetical protein